MFCDRRGEQKMKNRGKDYIIYSTKDTFGIAIFIKNSKTELNRIEFSRADLEKNRPTIDDLYYRLELPNREVTQIRKSMVARVKGF